MLSVGPEIGYFSFLFIHVHRLQRTFDLSVFVRHYIFLHLQGSPGCQRGMIIHYVRNHRRSIIYWTLCPPSKGSYCVSFLEMSDAMLSFKVVSSLRRKAVYRGRRHRL